MGCREWRLIPVMAVSATVCLHLDCYWRGEPSVYIRSFGPDCTLYEILMVRLSRSKMYSKPSILLRLGAPKPKVIELTYSIECQDYAHTIFNTGASTGFGFVPGGIMLAGINKLEAQTKLRGQSRQREGMREVAPFAWIELFSSCKMV